MASTIIQPQLTSVLWTDRRAHAEQNLRGPSAVFCKSRIRNLLFLATEADSERAVVLPFLGIDVAAGPTTVRPKSENMRESSACLVLLRGEVTETIEVTTLLRCQEHCEACSDRSGHWEEYNWQLIGRLSMRKQKISLGVERKNVTVGCQMSQSFQTCVSA